MEEFVDYLNSKGEVIGSGSLANAHKNKIWHRVVVGFIINNNLDVLLQLRGKNMSFPNMWDATVAGLVDCGESEIDAIHREFKEEIGIAFNKNKIQRVLTIKYKRKHKGCKAYQFMDFYIINCNVPLSRITLQRSEVEKVEWVSLEKYIYKLKSKDKNYLCGPKKVWQALQAYLMYKKFINN